MGVCTIGLKVWNKDGYDFKEELIGLHANNSAKIKLS